MTTVYVEYDERSYGGDKIDPNVKWSEREDTITEFRVEGVTLNRPDTPYYTMFDVPLTPETHEVYVIHVRFSTGDTFGRETGCGKITNVCLTKEEAAQVLNSIEDGSHPDSYYWKGYFERFESCHAECFSIREGSKALHRYRQ